MLKYSVLLKLYQNLEGHFLYDEFKIECVKKYKANEHINNL